MPTAKPKDTSKFTAGSSFAVNGYYDSSVNDNHGTGCVGVMAGNRNGTGMHGVAWGSEIYSANTGGTDDTNYGPFLTITSLKPATMHWSTPA